MATSSAIARSPSKRSRSPSERMPAPTLGCQIAPHYDHDQWPYNTDSSDTDSDSDDQAQGTSESAASAQHGLDIEKAETQRDLATIPTARPALSRGRTKSSRREAPQAPVGFWHWQMVHCSKPDRRHNQLIRPGWCEITCLEALVPNQ